MIQTITKHVNSIATNFRIEFIATTLAKSCKRVPAADQPESSSRRRVEPAGKPGAACTAAKLFSAAPAKPKLVRVACSVCAYNEQFAARPDE